MNLTFDIPDPLAKQLGASPAELSRRALEALAVESYRSGRLSRGQVRQMLGLSWHANEEFLAQNGCDRHYTLEDLEQDRRNLDEILGPA